MTDSNLILICAGLLGVIVHTFAKAISLQADAKKANMDFNIGDYFKHDWPAVGLSVAAVFVWWFVFPEASVKYPALLNWIRGSFIAVGAMGSYIIQLALSRAKKKINEVVDKKTDIADEKIKEE